MELGLPGVRTASVQKVAEPEVSIAQGSAQIRHHRSTGRNASAMPRRIKAVTHSRVLVNCVMQILLCTINAFPNKH